MIVSEKDIVLLTILKKMTDRKKLAFTLGCLERLPLQSLFNKEDAMLFADTMITMRICLDHANGKSQLDEFISIIAPRCGELHHAATGKLYIILDKYKVQARSYAADAIYATAELVYHYMADKCCPVNIMHALENIRLSQKWLDENNPAKLEEECLWQVHYAEGMLAGESHKKPSAEVIEFPIKIQ